MGLGRVDQKIIAARVNTPVRVLPTFDTRVETITQVIGVDD